MDACYHARVASLEELSEQIIVGLTAALDGVGTIDDVVLGGRDRPADTRLLALRMHLHEILTGYAVMGVRPGSAAASELRRVHGAAHIPTTTRRARIVEHATVAIGNALEVLATRPPPLIEPPPVSWVQLGVWAGEMSAFAVRSLPTPDPIIARALDVARAASLAALEGNAMLLRQLLRWTPFLPAEHRARVVLVDLSTFTMGTSAHPLHRLLEAFTRRQLA
jgi:hypothetical protein